MITRVMRKKMVMNMTLINNYVRNNCVFFLFLFFFFVIIEHTSKAKYRSFGFMFL